MLPPETHVGAVELTVMDLETQLRFYEGILGFRAKRESNVADLGIVKLVEDPQGAPRPMRSTGLYHMAILLPARADLGRVIAHLVKKHWPLQGASDHMVSEALYLADPEGNGIEIYADRPRETWRALDQSLKMGTQPMDVDDVLASAEGTQWQGVPAGTRMGHVHLMVADVREAQRFYTDAIGFDVMAAMGDSASFVSAGGYHHHVGMNAWQSRGAPPPPAHSTGLREFTILLPNAAALDEVAARLAKFGAPVGREDGSVRTSDPSGNGVRVSIA